VKNNQTPETPALHQELVDNASEDPTSEAKTHDEEASVAQVCSDTPLSIAPFATTSASPSPLSHQGILFRSLVAFLILVLLSWFTYRFVGFRGSGIAPFEGMRIGNVNYVEISLVREDIQNLACASNIELDGLRCGFQDQGTPQSGLSEAQTIRQYNTIKNELFLAAGLWAQPVMQGPLPTERFSVVCEFHSAGALKNPKLRWNPSEAFKPIDRTLVVGKLAHCVIPR
jgi:hypothetical protein